MPYVNGEYVMGSFTESEDMFKPWAAEGEGGDCLDPTCDDCPPKKRSRSLKSSPLVAPVAAMMAEASTDAAVELSSSTFTMPARMVNASAVLTNRPALEVSLQPPQAPAPAPLPPRPRTRVDEIIQQGD